jgi:hypothetical protein
MASGVASAAVAGESVFVAGIMTGVAYVALSVARFVSVKMIEGLRSALRHWSMVAVAGIVAVVDVTVKAAVAVIPGTGSDKQSA